MNIAGQFRPIPTSALTAPVAGVLQQGLELVEDLSHKLQHLDSLMLTGKPIEISEAAAVVEMALKTAAPAFAEIAETMGRLGASNLAAAAAQLRHIEDDDAAGLAEALRSALARFAKRSVSANRRAHQLNRGLNAALKTLQALGVEESGRLIAEA
jgi:hypothetical protein